MAREYSNSESCLKVVTERQRSTDYQLRTAGSAHGPRGVITDRRSVPIRGYTLLLLFDIMVYLLSNVYNKLRNTVKMLHHFACHLQRDDRPKLFSESPPML